jgi:hypothetical protein
VSRKSPAFAGLFLCDPTGIAATLPGCIGFDEASPAGQMRPSMAAAFRYSATSSELVAIILEDVM